MLWKYYKNVMDIARLILYLGIIVIVPHALVSFHLTRLYMRQTLVQNWWCHHDVTVWSSQLHSYPCQQWRKHACHVNSQVSHICHVRVTLLPCHSLPCHLHINLIFSLDQENTPFVPLCLSSILFWDVSKHCPISKNKSH